MIATTPAAHLVGAPSRVLVVHDSVLVRQLVARVLDAEPSMELAGVAPNGRVALEKIARLRPDVVLLDVDMPELDGLATLAEIRRLDPVLPVVTFDDLAPDGGAAGLEALALAAIGVVPRPPDEGIGLVLAQIGSELTSLLRAALPAPAAPADAASAYPGRPTVSVVVVAVSTGGPNALATIVPALPSDLSVPILIVQHMPTLFTGLLAERLDRLAAVTVVEATDGELVVPGRVYIAPGGRHLSLTGTTSLGNVRVALNDGPAENSCRPAADVLFRGAAAAYGRETLAVVLTGMGRDGLRGSEAVRAAGGHVIAQTEARAVAASMPAAVAAAGLTDAVVPLERIAEELVRRTAAGGPVQ